MAPSLPTSRRLHRARVVADLQQPVFVAPEHPHGRLLHGPVPVSVRHGLTAADTAAFTAKYTSATPTMTRVVALSGSDDPWSPACVPMTLSNAYVQQTATCDGCGHCGDLGAPHAGENPAIAVQHAAIAAYVTQWLA